MADVASVTSGIERLRPLVLRAAEHGQVEDLRALIQQGKQEKSLNDSLLRWALQKASERGQIGTVNLLLEEKVDWDANSGGDRGLTALYRATQRGHKNIVQILLEQNANVDAIDKNGRSVLYAAAAWNRPEILRMLIQHGANVNARDREERTVIHCLAADKTGRWSNEIIDILLATPIDLEYPDNLYRTALHWACATGKENLARKLLLRRIYPRADINAATNRGKTALHLAAEAGHLALVKLLLEFRADPMARSDGGWTPLHNAAREGYAEIVETLVQANCSINVCTSSGMTPLHWASQRGHTEVVGRILKQRDVWRNSKDVYDNTPLIYAAVHNHTEVVKLLAPLVDLATLSHDTLGACQGFTAHIVDFGVNGTKAVRTDKRTVYEVLYGRSLQDPTAYSVTTLVQNLDTKPNFRWIHLPANNMAWVETLITKAFLEDGASDVEGFKALQATFGQQHRGPTIYSRSMRPLCQRIERSNRREEPRPPPTPIPESAAASIINEISSPKSPRGAKSQENGIQKGATKTKTKPTGKPGKKVPSPGGKAGQATTRKDRQNAVLPRGNMVLFIPYLHFETERRRAEMNRAIREAGPENRRRRLRQPTTEDEMLIRAYLHSSTQLHVRRSDEHFYLHGIDDGEGQHAFFFNEKNRNREEKKVLAIDQFWCWILGRDLIITSFPQRWQQPKNDPFNVLDGIVEGISSRTGDPILSVYDLATLITSRCLSVFDRHQMGSEDNRLLNMFEAIVGEMAREESALFSRFYRASAAATAWLKRKRRTLRASRNRPNRRNLEIDQLDDLLEQTAGHVTDSEDDDDEPVFVDSLLDVGKESSLLALCKDAQNKLEIIQNVLDNQKKVLLDMKDVICDDLSESARQRKLVFEKNFGMLLKKTDLHIDDVRRMHILAGKTYDKIIPLLDLKQKHANAFEARFARDQAASSTRQGQVILVFTIVTIIFLPMSFIAAFFAINIRDFPTEGGRGLSLSYVSKFVFPVGLAISIPLIVLAFSVNSFQAAQRRVLRAFRHKHRSSPTSSTSASSEELQLPVLEPLSRFSKDETRSVTTNDMDNGHQHVMVSPDVVGIRRPSSIAAESSIWTTRDSGNNNNNKPRTRRIVRGDVEANGVHELENMAQKR